MILLVIHVLCTLYWGTTSSFKNIVIGNLVIRHWFTWGIGAYLAECYFYKKPFLSKVPLTTLILGFILFYFSKLFVFHFATDSLFSTVLIAIIVEKYLSKKSFIMSSFEKGLTIIGLCSYSFYLMHLPILQELFLRIDLFKLREVHSLLFLSVNALPVFIIIFSISYISYLLIEKKSIGVGELILRKIKFNKKAT
jgi:peptidoglycan/LPS O-acetylase OafA/YrhL